VTAGPLGDSTGAAPASNAARVVLVDDSALFRRGLATLLSLAGLSIVGELQSAGALAAVLDQQQPDVVVLDVRMPPTHTDEGIRTALAVRASHPGIGVLVLSTYAEGTWARQLFESGSAGLGYLLKDRVDDVTTLVDAIERVRTGGTVVDPEVVARLVAVTSQRAALDHLTGREREVLTLMAEGRSNVGIGNALFLSPRTVEAHIASLFGKLPLDHDDNTRNRRVLAVLAFLQDPTGPASPHPVHRQ
jgi:DNA-binding NarL/FixJ family response regulator